MSDSIMPPAPPVAPARPAMRQPLREKTSRELADERAKQILGHIGGLDEGPDDFFVAPDKIPDGWTCEWKTRTVHNMEDPAYQVALARTGWEPVPASRHPEMMPKGGKHETIERKGQVLMMRPEVITDQVRGLDRRKARDQVRVKEQQLGSEPVHKFGEAGRQTPATIRKSYEPMPVPDTV